MVIKRNPYIDPSIGLNRAGDLEVGSPRVDYFMVGKGADQLTHKAYPALLGVSSHFPSDLHPGTSVAAGFSLRL